MTIHPHHHELPLEYTIITRWLINIMFVSSTQDSTFPDVSVAINIAKTNTMLGLFDFSYIAEEEEG